MRYRTCERKPSNMLLVRWVNGLVVKFVRTQMRRVEWSRVEEGREERQGDRGVKVVFYSCE